MSMIVLNSPTSPLWTASGAMSASGLPRKCIANGIVRLRKKYMENPNGNSDNVMKHS